MTAHHRPLSPHLQVYRPQINTTLSILHRITGFALGVGTLLFTCWLFALLQGGDSFQCLMTFSQSLVGQIMLGGWLFSFVYHALNGIRHLIWDMGYGITIKANYASGIAIVLLTLALTFLIWTGA